MPGSRRYEGHRQPAATVVPGLAARSACWKHARSCTQGPHRAPSCGIEMSELPIAPVSAKEPDDSRGGLNDVIDEVELDNVQKAFLRARWLSDLQWQDRNAKKFQRFHYAFRLVAIGGGVIVPALVGLNPTDDLWRGRVRVLAFVLSLLVAIAVAVEGFFRFGDRWRHYRRN